MHTYLHVGVHAYIFYLCRYIIIVTLQTSVEEIPPQNVEFFEMQAAMKSRSPYKASWVAQFRAVLWRSWMSMIKEPMVLFKS